MISAQGHEEIMKKKEKTECEDSFGTDKSMQDFKNSENTSGIMA
jgi:hypothetical protein